MGGGDINDKKNFLLDITLDIKVVPFSLPMLFLTWFVNLKVNMYYALLHKVLCIK